MTALTRLTYAAAGFVALGQGSFTNIVPIAVIKPEVLNSVYGSSKTYVAMHPDLSRTRPASRDGVGAEVVAAIA